MSCALINGSSYPASLPPLVPPVQDTKSFRNDLSLEDQLKGRLPSNDWEIDGGWERAKPLESRLLCAL